MTQGDMACLPGTRISSLDFHALFTSASGTALYNCICSRLYTPFLQMVREGL